MSSLLRPGQCDGVSIIGKCQCDDTLLLDKTDDDVLLDLETLYWATKEGLANIALLLQESFRSSSVRVFTTLPNLVNIWLRCDFPLCICSSAKIRPGIYQVVMNLHPLTHSFGEKEKRTGGKENRSV